MNNGYYALFLQTGSPTFYLLSKRTAEQCEAAQ